MSNITKLYPVIKKGWRAIFGSILFGQVLGLWLFPWLARLYGERLNYPIESIYSFILLYLVPIYLLTLFYSPTLGLWVRYSNNYEFPEPPITVVDLIGLALLSALWGTYISRNNWLPHVTVSESWRTWGFFIGIAVASFGILVWGRGRRLRAGGLLIDRSQGTEYFADEPIVDDSQDLLNRGSFVEDLYRQITCYPLPESFVFGLYGEWGEGKTSVLNLLRRKLAARNDVLVFDFDPWVYSSSQALIQTFYEGLYRTLNRKYFLLNEKKGPK